MYGDGFWLRRLRDYGVDISKEDNADIMFNPIFIQYLGYSLIASLMILIVFYDILIDGNEMLLACQLARPASWIHFCSWPSRYRIVCISHRIAFFVSLISISLTWSRDIYSNALRIELMTRRVKTAFSSFYCRYNTVNDHTDNFSLANLLGLVAHKIVLQMLFLPRWPWKFSVNISVHWILIIMRDH